MHSWDDLDGTERLTMAKALRQIADRLDPPAPTVPPPTPIFDHPLSRAECQTFASRLRHLSINRYVDGVALDVERVGAMLR